MDIFYSKAEERKYVIRFQSMNFTDTALSLLKPGDAVLDLGAGAGSFAAECVDRQANVTAVDRRQPVEQHPDIDWRIMDVRGFIEGLKDTDMYRLIHSRNLIQFLDMDWSKRVLFPTLQKHLLPGGMIGIQTFYQDPEPTFERPISSRYTAADLEVLLQPMEVIDAKMFRHAGPDMRGVPRIFFITTIIARKP